ncbi:MAG: flagellar hook-length control protein FliK [Planctomycetota bacterium]
MDATNAQLPFPVDSKSQPVVKKSGRQAVGSDEHATQGPSFRETLESESARESREESPTNDAENVERPLDDIAHSEESRPSDETAEGTRAETQIPTETNGESGGEASSELSAQEVAQSVSDEAIPDDSVEAENLVASQVELVTPSPESFGDVISTEPVLTTDEPDAVVQAVSTSLDPASAAQSNSEIAPQLLSAATTETADSSPGETNVSPPTVEPTTTQEIPNAAVQNNGATVLPVQQPERSDASTIPTQSTSSTPLSGGTNPTTVDSAQSVGAELQQVASTTRPSTLTAAGVNAEAVENTQAEAPVNELADGELTQRATLSGNTGLSAEGLNAESDSGLDALLPQGQGANAGTAEVSSVVQDSERTIGAEATAANQGGSPDAGTSGNSQGQTSDPGSGFAEAEASPIAFRDALSPVAQPNRVSAFEAMMRAAEPGRAQATGQAVSVMTQMVESMGSEPVRVATVELQPIELGKLSIRIEQTGDSISATILASESSTSDLLNGQKSNLQEALADLGYEDASVDVSRGEQDEQPGSEQNKNGQRVSFVGTEAVESNASERNYNSNSGVDIVV